MSAGHVVVGDWVSFTVTVKVHVSGPAPLFEAAVTVVVPTGKNEPEAGELVTRPHEPE